MDSQTDGRMNRKSPHSTRLRPLSGPLPKKGFICLAGWLTGPQAWLAGPQAWLAGSQAWLAGTQAWLDGSEGEWMDGQMNGTKKLYILQDFVPYLGHCPASPHENQEE